MADDHRHGVAGERPARLDVFLRRHRAWARQLGLLDRPWLILGSAPEPTVPAALLRTHARIDINNAGRTAAESGWGRAALTVRAEKKTFEEHPHLDTAGLLWVHRKPSVVLPLLLWTKPHDHVGNLIRMTPGERDLVVTTASEASVRAIGDLGKVTNGVAALCYGLLLGVPEIVLAGVSLSKAGHSYDTLGRTRRQIEEDGFILGRLKDRPGILTTEQDLAADCGLRLWASTDTASSP